MLEVEMDIFSGTPNPSWVLTKEEESQVLEIIEADPDQISPVSTEKEKFGLGYRGFLVRTVKDEVAWHQLQSRLDRRLPEEFRVGSRPTESDASIAQYLLEGGPARRNGLDDELRDAASRGVALVQPPPPEGGFESQPQPPTAKAEPDTSPEADEEDYLRGYTWHRPCPSSYFYSNADIFNRPEFIYRTNCYAYACNYLYGGRYAHPGAHGGKPATSMTVDSIRGGLYVDGWADNCQPKSLTIAAVVWPNWDFHFYRLATGSPYWVWGHKLATNAAVHYDNCGYAIRRTPHYLGTIWQHPANCCRGGYTDWVGWFYQNNDEAYCKQPPWIPGR
ncbi:hypothetical protein OG361_22610 [Streptomyces sp. NBC_00090]|uniref:hypothetical protein n=1 Tax=Streptomyces sp. NBC_00090 TaxID=2903619 RepID=UPI00324D0F8A